MSLFESENDYYFGRRRQISLIALVLVNLLPLAGVLWFSWDAAALMLLYWAENLILGFYTLSKMLVVSPVGGLFSGTFFLIHYGGFCGVHGMFILLFMFEGDFSPFPGNAETWPLFFVFPQILFNVTREVFAIAPAQWVLAFTALFISHGISFVFNFLMGPERELANTKALMGEPYGRIVVLHIAIIVGGMGTMALGEPLLMLLVLVGLKLAMDVGLHLRTHRKASPHPV
ncbi:hypothetical protein EY643_07365 [Halioglobus maricola]|uniref:Uncharacterized protein n=1 Tax=Halioglobus maricola TaxID=2601894 RepID=A0A5P9NJT3_9GAMM|nr:DUF6498-containing protein [Halioglobus maricola]QFU75484.1 hypothetical protein EY643_07365 [Halioglobus maricola]